MSSVSILKLASEARALSPSRIPSASVELAGVIEEEWMAGLPGATAVQ